MSAIQKVLLADPVMVSHSLLYYEAALASTGFENAHFTIATVVVHDADRKRAIQFSAAKKNTTLRLLDVDVGKCVGRLRCWRGFGRSMRAIEKLLETESFDLIAYVSLDLLLPNFALPGFKKKFPQHFKTGVAGTLFRDNGLRPPITNSTKARLRSLVDLWILRRALANTGLRKVAFLDHWCTDLAHEKFHTEKCGMVWTRFFRRRAMKPQRGQALVWRRMISPCCCSGS